jgi:hypothetical protein
MIMFIALVVIVVALARIQARVACATPVGITPEELARLAQVAYDARVLAQQLQAQAAIDAAEAELASAQVRLLREGLY